VVTVVEDAVEQASRHRSANVSRSGEVIYAPGDRSTPVFTVDRCDLQSHTTQTSRTSTWKRRLSGRQGWVAHPVCTQNFQSVQCLGTQRDHIMHMFRCWQIVGESNSEDFGDCDLLNVRKGWDGWTL